MHIITKTSKHLAQSKLYKMDANSDGFNIWQS